jgi:hypothetical protein
MLLNPGALYVIVVDPEVAPVETRIGFGLAVKFALLLTTVTVTVPCGI